MFLFEKSLDNKVDEVIKRYSGGKQALVFCASKSGCEKLSQLLSQRFQSFANPGAYSDRDEINQIQDGELIHYSPPSLLLIVLVHFSQTQGPCSKRPRVPSRGYSSR
jgi:hypothetical protein